MLYEIHQNELILFFPSIALLLIQMFFYLVAALMRETCHGILSYTAIQLKANLGCGLLNPLFNGQLQYKRC